MSRLINELQKKIDVINEDTAYCKKFKLDPKPTASLEIQIYEEAIAAIKKEQLADRFFLEEAIYRNIKCWDEAEEYTDTLLHDWLSEMVKNNPLTEQERKDYIKNVLGWDDDFAESAYFASEKQLAHYLSTKDILEEEEPTDFSIVDASTNTD